MTIRAVQVEFSRLVPRLIDRAFETGFEVTLGDAFRDARAFGMIGVTKSYGHPRSAHKRRMAVDLNLFRDGRFCDSSEDHRELGEWWEQQHPLARWGGRWGDGNHYSFEWDGIK